ncbi:hypothetical protein BJ165DRAFT_1522942 [Panaeolus papilionaceus]|nr:hypothetical protein BJ165DRAFT_1522942 [Panaeolus papilionaceus]
MALAHAQFVAICNHLGWLLTDGPDLKPALNDDDKQSIQAVDALENIITLLFYITLILAFVYFDTRYCNHQQNFGVMMVTMDEDHGAEEDLDRDVVMLDAGATEGKDSNKLDHCQADTSLDKNLPLPSFAGNTGIQYVDITGAKKEQLLQWCRSLKLHVSGNKEALKSRLRYHSQEKLGDAWTNLTHPNAQRMHRGPRDGGISKAKTGSKKRVNTVDLRHQIIFGKPAVQPTPSHAKVSDHIEDRPQSMEEHTQLLSWADRIVEKSPYIPKHERDRLREEATRCNNSVKLVPHIETEIISMRKDLQSLVVRSASAGVHSEPNVSTRHNSPGASTSPSSAFPLPLSPSQSPASHPGTSPLPPPSSSLSSVHFVSHSALPLASPPHLLLPSSGTANNDNRFVRPIQIGANISLTLGEDDIPDPPPLSFTNEEIDKLNGMWDDTPPYWRGTSPLIVKGHRVPIKYWRNLYYSHLKLPSGEQWKAKQWNNVKSYYSKWRIIVARWRRLSQDDFWRDFTLSDGRRMAFSAMTGHLTEIRAREDAELAHQAQIEYGDRFDSVFSYRKGVRRIVKTRKVEIARQYRKLKTMESDWDLDDN